MHLDPMIGSLLRCSTSPRSIDLRHQKSPTHCEVQKQQRQPSGKKLLEWFNGFMQTVRKCKINQDPPAKTQIEDILNMATVVNVAHECGAYVLSVNSST